MRLRVLALSFVYFSEKLSNKATSELFSFSKSSHTLWYAAVLGTSNA